MADFRVTFPAKDRESDGTIGDAAHQAETSGHNPDDTPGSRSEYTDADSKAEVRAIDVDNDLRDPRGVTMQQVINRMLATAADLRRLRYIIYNRTIWSRSNDWRPRAYTGSSPHTEHAHFSGDPDTDEDASPWSSVLSFKEDDVNLTDTVPDTGTPATKGAPRNVGNVLHDQQQRRSIEIGELPLATYPAGAPYRKLLELPDVAAAAFARDEQRDNAALAAVNALAALIQQGGGSVDAAPIVAAVHAVADDTHALVVQLQQELAAARAELAEVRAELEATMSPAERASLPPAGA